MVDAPEDTGGSRSQREDTYPVGEERRMARAGGRKKLYEELDSRIWSQMWWVAEVSRYKWSLHTPGQSDQQLGLERPSPLEGSI